MCSCPVWWSSTEFTGFSFSMELKVGHGIQVLWAYRWWMGAGNNNFPWPTDYVLANTAQYEVGPYWRNHIQLIIFNSSGPPGSLLAKLTSSQACLQPAPIYGVTATQVHDFTFAIEIYVVPFGPFLKLTDAPQLQLFLLLAGHRLHSFFLIQSNHYGVLIVIQIIRPLKALVCWRKFRICALRLPTPSSLPRE